MESCNLSDIITALEYGNKFHIAVVMLDRSGNEKTRLPLNQRTHETPICETAKNNRNYSQCYRCRETVLRMACTRKKVIEGLCVHGVHEYCRPMIREDRVVGVILIGNIYTGTPEQLEKLSKNDLLFLTDTMQHDFSHADCVRIADVLESYIGYLLDTFGERNAKTFDTLVEDIRNHIEENIQGDLSLSTLAEHYNYNEKYLGRLFKQRTGYSFHEYCNRVRLDKAKKLLRSTDLSVYRIAAQIGYNNVAYFIRVFKQFTQMSPLQYRQKKKASVAQRK